MKFHPVSLVIGFAAALTQSSLFAAPTFIKPGQCIHVGSTEVCASMPGPENCTQSKDPARSEHLFSCRYDLHAHPEMPGLKTYALLRTTLLTNGKKSETIIKNYGISDKDGCEAAADKKNSP